MGTMANDLLLQNNFNILSYKVILASKDLLPTALYFRIKFWYHCQNFAFILCCVMGLSLLSFVWRHNAFHAVTFCCSWLIHLNFQHNDLWHRINVILIWGMLTIPISKIKKPGLKVPKENLYCSSVLMVFFLINSIGKSFSESTLM